VLLSAVSDLSPMSDDAIRIVRALRETRAVADGQLRVTGPAARNLDINEFIGAHAPLAVAFVMGVSGFVLFLALGSVLLPLKAILMNLLSISASFGALVFIFQDGHFASLLGFEARPIEPSLPVLLFCCVFGLSMDYEVLLLERIREEYRRGATNTVAVAEGLEKSASQITSAAAIMVTLFSVFGFTEVVLLKAVGVGLAIAVALDATVVRLLIVPATMRLFGDLNWWAPQWTRRWFGPTRAPATGRVSSPGLPAFPPEK
jgi:RND superfamily putative drug exporter